MVFELPGTGQRVADVVELSGFDAGGERFAVLFVQFRFGVEGIDLRDAAIHVEKNHAGGGGCVVRGVCGRLILGEQVIGGDGTEAAGGRLQQATASGGKRPKATTVMAGHGGGTGLGGGEGLRE